MSTLYRPVLIESVEQAEALPHGTWARSDVGGGIPEETVVRTADEHQPWRNGPAAWSSSEIVGWTALVPMEGEEEWAVSYDRDAPAWSSVTKERAQSPGVDETAHVRYATPWEEV